MASSEVLDHGVADFVRVRDMLRLIGEVVDEPINGVGQLADHVVSDSAFAFDFVEFVA